MIDRKDNPQFLNSFLDYMTVILNKSTNTVKEYNYDLAHFLKYLMKHYGLSNEEDLKSIDIHDMSIDVLKRVTLDDIH